MVKPVVSVTSSTRVSVATFLKKERPLQHAPRHVSRPGMWEAAILAQARTLSSVRHVRRLTHPEDVDVELRVTVQMARRRQSPCGTAGEVPSAPLVFWK